MSASFDDFLSRARAMTLADVADAFALPKKGRSAEQMGPCPSCGGTDCFGWNTRKNAWNCRAGGIGGRDAISLAAHLNGFDVKTRSGLILACEMVLDEKAPEDMPESDDERAAREAEQAERKRRADAKALAREQEAASFRQKEQAKARGKWLNAAPLPKTEAALYLALRCCYEPRSGGMLRFDTALDYWIEGEDGLQSIHCGPAMIAPFIDAQGEIIGCHQTWIDLNRPPKYRPDFGLDGKGEPCATKKMRGSKQGGLIPLAGFKRAGDLILPDHETFPKTRMVAGEGIETAVAVGGAEAFRPDTLYVAAGDLGNLAGRADPDSFFYHPHKTKADKNGRERPVRVPGPVPDFTSPAMPVMPGLKTLVLLADGDSERIFTAAAMARARERHIRPDLTIAVVWPGIDGDFSDLLGTEQGPASAEQSEKLKGGTETA